MTKRQFLDVLEEALELEPGTLRDELAFSDMKSWDSMTGLIFIAMADDQLGIEVSGDQVSTCKTVGDLIALVADALTD